jgi:hypothetical protein
VSNPAGTFLDVTAITTTTSGGAPGCPASDLVVTGYAGSLPVPARGSTHVTVTATLIHAAPDACQGVGFGLHFSGLGADL